MNDVTADCLNNIVSVIAEAVAAGVSDQAKEALRKILRLTIDERKRLYEGVAGEGGESAWSRPEML
jgi:hypothetical protein